MGGSIASHVGRKRLAEPMSVYMIPTATVLAVGGALEQLFVKCDSSLVVVPYASAFQTFVVAHYPSISSFAQPHV